MTDYLILVVAAFAAGVTNTIAGGGTFISFPALVFVGIPPVVANATSTVAVFPGYLAGALGFRAEMRGIPRARLARLSALTLAGALAGSLLLLVSSDRAFSAIVPFLLLFATIVFLFGDRLRSFASVHAAAADGGPARGGLGLVLVSVYGGYFNGGLGIVLLALFSFWGMTDIHLMNGLKTFLSFVLAAISVATFAVAGIVAWPEALVMMVAATAGGYAGAPIARALPKRVVRGIVAAIGFGMSAIFFARLF